MVDRGQLLQEVQEVVPADQRRARWHLVEGAPHVLRWPSVVGVVFYKA